MEAGRVTIGQVPREEHDFSRVQSFEVTPQDVIPMHPKSQLDLRREKNDFQQAHVGFAVLLVHEDQVEPARGVRDLVLPQADAGIGGVHDSNAGDVAVDVGDQRTLGRFRC